MQMSLEIYLLHPSGDLIFEGIQIFKENSGCILLISNHAGDVMNGEMAIELAKEHNINADLLLMYDDIASAPRGTKIKEGEARALLSFIKF